MKWVFGITISLIASIALAIAVSIWFAMSVGLHQTVEDNLLELRRAASFQNDPFTIDYSSLDVSHYWLIHPALRIENLKVDIQSGAKNYQLEIPELKIIGDFRQLERLQARTPKAARLIISDGKNDSKVLNLSANQALEILLAKHENGRLLREDEEATSLIHYYKFAESAKIKLQVRQQGVLKTTLDVPIFAQNNWQDLKPPYSAKLAILFNKLESKIK